MKNILKSKFFRCSLFLILLGVAFIFFENTFYQYIDKNGILHESWFLPLGVFSLLFGAVGLCFAALQAAYLFFNKK